MSDLWEMLGHSPGFWLAWVTWLCLDQLKPDPVWPKHEDGFLLKALESAITMLFLMLGYTGFFWALRGWMGTL